MSAPSRGSRGRRSVRLRLGRGPEGAAAREDLEERGGGGQRLVTGRCAESRMGVTWARSHVGKESRGRGVTWARVRDPSLGGRLVTLLPGTAGRHVGAGALAGHAGGVTSRVTRGAPHGACLAGNAGARASVHRPCRCDGALVAACARACACAPADWRAGRCNGREGARKRVTGATACKRGRAFARPGHPWGPEML